MKYFDMQGAETYLIVIVTVTILIILWIVHTVLSDFQTAFYRKAMQYRKIVNQQKRDQSSRDIRENSFVSSSQFSSKGVPTDRPFFGLATSNDLTESATNRAMLA